MLSVKNNLMAANAARHLSGSYDALARSVERLASGLRINSARDDAAGLAVRELVRADVATLEQGARNARDAISMIQTGEGAMAVIDDILVRMKELAEQAATESYSGDQRTIMNAEFAQLGDEITRIAQSTKFNGIELLNSSTTYSIHIGTATTIDIDAQVMDGATLGVTKTRTVAANNQVTATESGDWFGSDTGVDFLFTFAADAATHGQITVAFADEGSPGGDDNWTITQVAAQINAASQTAGDYNAASVVYDGSTKIYTLKLVAEAAGSGALTVTADSVGTALDAANWNQTAGSDTGLSIATAGDAASALDDIDDAIKTKDEYRAKLGYLMNRLEAATDIQAENLMAAESRISDVDVATEMARMTRTQVLAQAGISMLAQANSMPQMALALLQ